MRKKQGETYKQYNWQVYNQAVKCTFVVLETRINRLQECNKGALSSN